MRALLPIAMVTALLGCSDDETDPPVDAILTTDGSTTGDAAMAIDGPASSVCTGAVYDPCVDGTQCLSGMCQAFGQAGITVCTQACDDATPCPMQGGAAVGCNNRNLCRPEAANDCTR